MMEEVSPELKGRLVIQSMERLEPLTREALKTSEVLEGIRTQFHTLESEYKEYPVGILMGEICTRSGSVARAVAQDFNGYDMLALRKLLVEQGALVVQAIKEFDKLLNSKS
jgi:hypothetical protein